jgi:selenide,water dikinase
MTAPSTRPTGHLYAVGSTAIDPTIRLTRFAHGGGCACKIPPGELEDIVRGLTGGSPSPDLLVGLDDGDDAAVVQIDAHTALVHTADFFTPVVDGAYDWGRIAAANALSDVYAMGGRPIVAVNLVGWPRDLLPVELLREVLRGGLDIAREAGCHVGGGHSIDSPEPLYGMAVTGLVDPDHLLRNDAAQPGTPISLTKPLGVGVLNNRHRVTGENFPQAVACMVALNAAAGAAAVAGGAVAATDVTGFGLLGHLHKMARASGVQAVIDAASVPYLDGARQALRDGFVSGGTRRNLEWVRPFLESSVSQDELLLLADAQTSGGLLVAGEVPGAPVVGEFVAAAPGSAWTISVR